MLAGSLASIMSSACTVDSDLQPVVAAVERRYSGPAMVGVIDDTILTFVFEGGEATMLEGENRRRFAERMATLAYSEYPQRNRLRLLRVTITSEAGPPSHVRASTLNPTYEWRVEELLAFSPVKAESLP